MWYFISLDQIFLDIKGRCVLGNPLFHCRLGRHVPEGAFSQSFAVQFFHLYSILCVIFFNILSLSIITNYSSPSCLVLSLSLQHLFCLIPFLSLSGWSQFSLEFSSSWPAMQPSLITDMEDNLWTCVLLFIDVSTVWTLTPAKFFQWIFGSSISVWEVSTKRSYALDACCLFGCLMKSCVSFLAYRAGAFWPDRRVLFLTLMLAHKQGLNLQMESRGFIQDLGRLAANSWHAPNTAWKPWSKSYCIEWRAGEGEAAQSFKGKRTEVVSMSVSGLQWSEQESSRWCFMAELNTDEALFASHRAPVSPCLYVLDLSVCSMCYIYTVLPFHLSWCLAS